MAVGDAGGFGILGGGYGERAWLEQETAKLRQARSPFGIGFITWSLARQPELLDIALDAKPRAIMLSFGDPKLFASRIKSTGALLICQVQDEEIGASGARCRRRYPDPRKARRPAAMARRLAPQSISCLRSSISPPAGYRLWRPAALPMGAGLRR